MDKRTYCDREVADDPRYQYTEPTFNPAPGTWAPDCGHPACVADDEAHAEVGHDWDCAIAECRWNAARGTCDFEAGHAGDHSYALPSTPEARLVPYETPAIEVVLIRIVPPSYGQLAGTPS